MAAASFSVTRRFFDDKNYPRGFSRHGDYTIKESQVLEQYGLKDVDYSFSLCRIEPENNVHITLEAFKRTGKELFFIGNWERSSYGKMLKDKYGDCENIHLLSPIYDVKVLNVLRSHCCYYIH